MSSIRKYTSPGLVLGVVAIVIALAGTSLAGDKTRTHPAGSVKRVDHDLARLVQQLSIPPQSTNEGKVEATVNCPSGTPCGRWRSYVRLRHPANGRRPACRVGPGNSQGNGWHVRYDNDQNTARSATVTALCLGGKLTWRSAT